MRKGDLVSLVLDSRWFPLVLSTLSDAPASLHSFAVCRESCDMVAGGCCYWQPAIIFSICLSLFDPLSEWI